MDPVALSIWNGSGYNGSIAIPRTVWIKWSHPARGTGRRMSGPSDLLSMPSMNMREGSRALLQAATRARLRDLEPQQPLLALGRWKLHRLPGVETTEERDCIVVTGISVDERRTGA